MSYGQPPPKKSNTGKIIGAGCGCLLLFGCLVGGGFAVSGIMSLGPGEEVASTDAVLGQPFSVTYTQSGDQRYETWLDVDLSYTSGYHLTGNAILAENGVAFGQYTIDDDGSGSAVAERNGGTRYGWTSTNLGGDGSSAGNVSLFPIPARTDGGTVTISGTINAPPGTTGTVRLLVTER